MNCYNANYRQPHYRHLPNPDSPLTMTIAHLSTTAATRPLTMAATRPLTTAAIRTLTIAAAICFLLLWLTAPTHAQQYVSQDGHLLDANPRVGSLGLNTSVHLDSLIPRARLSITGNLSGGASFQGIIPYASPHEFTGSLGSSSLGDFRRDSVGLNNLYSGFTGPVPYVDSTRGVTRSMGTGVINTGRITPSFTPVGATLRTGPNNYLGRAAGIRPFSQPYSSLDFGDSALSGTFANQPANSLTAPAKLPWMTKSPLDRRQPQPFAEQLLPNTEPDRPSLLDRDQTSLLDRDRTSLLDRDETSSLNRDQVSPFNRDRTSLLDRDQAQTPSDVDPLDTAAPFDTTAPLDTAAPFDTTIPFGTHPATSQPAMRDSTSSPGTHNPIFPSEAPEDDNDDSDRFLPTPSGGVAGVFADGAIKSDGRSDGRLSAAPATERISLDIAAVARAQFSRYMMQGKQLMKQGKYYRAANAFGAATLYDQQNIDALQAKAHALFAAGEYMSAAYFVNRLLQMKPEQLNDRTDLRELFSNKGQFNQRMKDLDRWQKQAGHSMLLFIKGYALYEIGEFDQAEAVLMPLRSSPLRIESLENLIAAVTTAAQADPQGRSETADEGESH